MTTLHTLASGSSGNALLFSCGSTHLLVDAGISCRRITKSLEELGLTPADLHRHSYHPYPRRPHLRAADPSQADGLSGLCNFPDAA